MSQKSDLAYAAIKYLIVQGSEKGYADVAKGRNLGGLAEWRPVFIHVRDKYISLKYIR